MESFSSRLCIMLNGRKPKKIKKIELAKALYVTPQTVSRWCNGNIIPDRGTIELITKEINNFYGFPKNSPKCFRSEWLACEDNIQTYDFVSPEIMLFVEKQKDKEQLCVQLEPYIQYFSKKLDYDINDIVDNEHFISFVVEYIELAIRQYFDYINVNRKEGE